ncbi:MAG: dockerin type I repeat-containing protein [Acutalibacteraceae bacterium]
MKKKLLSAILCTALAAVSIVSTSALDADNPASGASLNYKIIGETTLKNNYATLYTFGSNIDPTSGISLTDRANNKAALNHYFSSPAPKGVSKYLPSTSGYSLSTSLGSSSGGGSRALKFVNTGGTYEKIRVKLSDFSSYFNSNGTHSMAFFDNPSHDYNFTKESSAYTSSLIFFSGGAITAVAPDSNGYAEIYVSTKLGTNTFFTTDFCGNNSCGGGTTGSTFAGFTIGDVDKNGYISLNDAIFIQKYNVGMETFDELSKRNADTNRDGKINLKDTVKVQKYNLYID